MRGWNRQGAKDANKIVLRIVPFWIGKEMLWALSNLCTSTNSVRDY